MVCSQRAAAYTRRRPSSGQSKDRQPGQQDYRIDGDDPRLFRLPSSSHPTAPGQLLKHYAPRLPLRINVEEEDVKEDEFFIAFGKVSRHAELNLSPSGNLEEAAANLFAYMREAEKHTNYKGIAMSPIPMAGLGLAINGPKSVIAPTPIKINSGNRPD